MNQKSEKKLLVLIYIKPYLVLFHFLWLWWKRGLQGQKIKVAQNGLKHISVLEFLRSNNILKFCKCAQPGKQGNKTSTKRIYRHYCHRIKRWTLHGKHLTERLFFNNTENMCRRLKQTTTRTSTCNVVLIILANVFVMCPQWFHTIQKNPSH